MCKKYSSLEHLLCLQVSSTKKPSWEYVEVEDNPVDMFEPQNLIIEGKRTRKVKFTVKDLNFSEIATCMQYLHVLR